MIELQEVTKTYGSFQFHVSMTIPNGRITGVVGKNGAGKSTAIKLMLGLVRPDSGEIRIDGKNSTRLSAKDKEMLGVSLAEAGFSNQLTVSDIEKILSKMYPQFDQKYFSENCQRMGLPLKQKIKEFSTGMKAKLRVLTATSHRARVLVLDEPTAGLDVEARNEILDLLRACMLEDEERSLLITSHISSDLENLCDDIYLIHDGKIILHEDTDVILEQYGVIKVSEEQYRSLDSEHLLKVQEEPYGYACFTSDKNYYRENYPEVAVENGGIDELILMMTGGYR